MEGTVQAVEEKEDMELEGWLIMGKWRLIIGNLGLFMEGWDRNGAVD